MNDIDTTTTSTTTVTDVLRGISEASKSVKKAKDTIVSVVKTTCFVEGAKNCIAELISGDPTSAALHTAGVMYAVGGASFVAGAAVGALAMYGAMKVVKKCKKRRVNRRRFMDDVEIRMSELNGYEPQQL